MNCLIDGIEYERINNCIIFDEKYLIVHFSEKIEKYSLLNGNISLVSEYSAEFNFSIYNQFNLIFIKIEVVDKNQYLHLSEVDDNYKKINEAMILIDSGYVYKIYIIKNYIYYLLIWIYFIK